MCSVKRLEVQLFFYNFVETNVRSSSRRQIIPLNNRNVDSSVLFIQKRSVVLLFFPGTPRLGFFFNSEEAYTVAA
jgi:hypothetical protein